MCPKLPQPSEVTPCTAAPSDTLSPTPCWHPGKRASKSWRIPRSTCGVQYMSYPLVDLWPKILEQSWEFEVIYSRVLVLQLFSSTCISFFMIWQPTSIPSHGLPTTIQISHINNNNNNHIPWWRRGDFGGDCEYDLCCGVFECACCGCGNCVDSALKLLLQEQPGRYVSVVESISCLPHFIIACFF